MLPPDTVIYMGGAVEGPAPGPLPREPAGLSVAAAPAGSEVDGAEVQEAAAGGKASGSIGAAVEAGTTLEVQDARPPPDATAGPNGSGDSPPTTTRPPLPPIIKRVLGGTEGGHLVEGLPLPPPYHHHTLTEMLKEMGETAVEYEHKIQDYSNKAVGEVRSMSIGAEEEAESMLHTLLHPRQAAAEWAARLMGRHSGLPGANPTPHAVPHHQSGTQQPPRSPAHNGGRHGA